MTRRHRAVPLAVGLMMVVAAGCGGEGTSASTAAPSTDSDTPDVSTALADIQERATEALLATIEELKATGYGPYFAYFDYRRCDGDNRFFALAEGRVDQPDEGGSTRANAEAALAMLVADGWEPFEDERFPDGIWEDNDRNQWRIGAGRDDLTIALGFYRLNQGVLLNVSGACVDVGEDRSREFALFTSIEYGDVIGATTTTAPPTSDAPETTATDG